VSDDREVAQNGVFSLDQVVHGHGGHDHAKKGQAVVEHVGVCRRVIGTRHGFWN
jgi:hypothetical protein